MGLTWVWGMFIFVLFDSHRSEPSVMNIYISFIHLTQVWGIFMWVWGGYEEYLYLFYSPRMGLMDIHTALERIGGMFIFLLLASDGSEPSVRNIHISFIHLSQVWGIIQVWGMSEECLHLFVCLPQVWSDCEKYIYLFYSPRTSLRHIHTGLRQVWGMFLFVLLASDESEPRLRNIHISFIHLRQVWGLSIWVWATYEEYSYLFHSPRTGLRDIHPGVMWVWGTCIFVVLPHTALSRESGIFIFTYDMSEGYLYGS